MQWGTWDEKGEFVFSLGLEDVGFPLGVAALRVLDAHAIAFTADGAVNEDLWIRRLGTSDCRSPTGQYLVFSHPERGFLSRVETDNEGNVMVDNAGNFMFNSHTGQEEIVAPTGEWILSIPSRLNQPSENATVTDRKPERQQITKFTLFLSLDYVMCRSPQCFGPRQSGNSENSLTQNVAAASARVDDVSTPMAAAGVTAAVVLAGAFGMLTLLVFVGKLKGGTPSEAQDRKVELARSCSP